MNVAIVDNKESTVTIQTTGKRKRSSRPKIVLEEDDYINALSIIIKRDFFPELVQLDAENEYLESIAVENADTQRVREATRRLTEIALHNAPTPRYGADSHNPMQSVPSTPYFDSSVPKPQDSTSSYNTDLSLDTFLDQYTSEDNASFREIVDAINEKRQATFDKLYGGDRDTERLITDGKTDQDGKIHRPAAIEGWKFDPRNTLMYFPDNEETSTLTLSRAQPKAIVHSNTRITSMEASNSVSSSPSLSHIEAVINGTPYPRRNVNGDETPRVNGYPMVAASPSPSELGYEAEQRMALENAPSDADVRGFRIPETPRRDLLGLRLSERATKSLNSQKALARNVRLGSTPRRLSTRISSPSMRAEILSPAGQRLLERSGRTLPSSPLTQGSGRRDWSLTPKARK